MIDELSTALDYVRGGLSIIPVKTDGTKRPDGSGLPEVYNLRQGKQVRTWEPYIYRTPSTTEVIEWFAWDDRAIGIVCGAVSGGLEVIDFDAGELFEPWKELAGAIVDRLPVVSTGGGGWHVFFRCCEIGGNCKIACDPSREKKTLIETRGQAGFVVGAGSPIHTHRSGRPYAQVSGPKLPEIPVINPSERRGLWAAARTFDKTPKQEVERIRKRLGRSGSSGQRKRHPAIKWFNERNSWDDILPSGWTVNGNTLTRPGKRFGVSAVFAEAEDKTELLIVYSSNAGPLSPLAGSHGRFNKFDAWVQLKHGGDQSRAFKQVFDDWVQAEHGGSKAKAYAAALEATA